MAKASFFLFAKNTTLIMKGVDIYGKIFIDSARCS